MNNHIFSIFLGAFITGIALSSFVAIGIFSSIFLLCLGITCLVYWFFVDRNRQHFFLLYITVALVSLGLGILRFDISKPQKEILLEEAVGKQITLTGIISDEPDYRESNARLTFKILEVGGKQATQENSALLVVDLYPKFQYGDKLTVVGTLKHPENFDTGGTRVFDYVSYLAKDGIYYEIRNPTVTRVGQGYGNPIKDRLFKIKHAFLKNVEDLLPEPHSYLLGGLVAGGKQTLGKNLLEEFKRAGVIHIVVLSGYNITLIANGIMWLLQLLPKGVAMSGGSIGIILFALMTGGSATVVRASIMALLVIFAKASRRTFNAKRALALAGFIMVFQNPRILIFDPSFQLSFLSTVGLIFVSPHLERTLLKIPEKMKLREIFSATISTQVFVLPFLLYSMGQVSLVALPVNLLILFFIPATMLFGSLAGLIAFFIKVLALPFGFIAYLLLSYELKIVEFASSLSFASINISYFPLWLMIIVYIFYGYVLWKLNRPKVKFVESIDKNYKNI